MDKCKEDRASSQFCSDTCVLCMLIEVAKMKYTLDNMEYYFWYADHETPIVILARMAFQFTLNIYYLMTF